MVASVPELTRRTISIEGNARVMTSASSTSASVGAPKDVPFPAAAVTAFTTSSGACPRISGPHEQT
jgi:hypothetical protein